MEQQRFLIFGAIPDDWPPTRATESTRTGVDHAAEAVLAYDHEQRSAKDIAPASRVMFDDTEFDPAVDKTVSPAKLSLRL